MYKCEHFSIKELVSPIVYNTWGEQAWVFFDEDILKDLDTIRETFGHPIIINNWSMGGNLKQCGLRSNMDEIVQNKKSLYLSAHIMGKGFDLHSSYGENKLWEHCCDLILKKKLRKMNGLEDYKNTKGWVHIQSSNIKGHIYIF